MSSVKEGDFRWGCLRGAAWAERIVELILVAEPLAVKFWNSGVPETPANPKSLRLRQTRRAPAAFAEIRSVFPQVSWSRPAHVADFLQVSNRALTSALVHGISLVTVLREEREMRLAILALLVVALMGLVAAGDTIWGARVVLTGRFRPEHCCAWIVTVRGRRMKQPVQRACV